MIRACRPADAGAIADIYNYYINETVISFEQTPLSEAEMAERIAKISANYPWLVAEEDGEILGFAYVALWQERVAYRHSLVTTVYLNRSHTGRGLGKALYEALFEALVTVDCRVLVAGIALPNAASVALHEKVGFEKVAHFKDVGRKHGQWVDVGYWQKTINTDREFP
ncbi:arsinothricin resistance N-acetyltransferase ArsN1 family B [Teredinibacter turnerae]|uniref:arsinothricin resistance N-acetyltransferase ArsN1 family B n=1 Tax=Teredinibacter turnerae TaxID=2426 RepID=UPI00040AA646|nr:arsinothricin resistance N-acetyltransferase ArsN1 family B [Teredinibacter turnerae]